jgi:hypothetical protein
MGEKKCKKRRGMVGGIVTVKCRIMRRRKATTKNTRDWTWIPYFYEELHVF